MSSDLLARLTVRSLPDRIRAERSEEIIGTLLDAGDRSRVEFARQAASVLGAGVRWRIRGAVAQPASALMRDALTWASLMTAARVMVNDLSLTRGIGIVLDTPELLLVVGPAVILAGFTLRLVRPAGVLGVVWTAALLRQAPDGDVLLMRALPLGLALVGFAMMGDARRHSTLARAAWMVPAGVLALVDFTSVPGGPLTAAAAVVFSGLLLAPFLPGCALGVALAWAAIAVSTLLSGAVGASTTASCLTAIGSVPIVVLAIVVTQRLSGWRGESSQT